MVHIASAVSVFTVGFVTSESVEKCSSGSLTMRDEDGAVSCHKAVGFSSSAAFVPHGETSNAAQADVNLCFQTYCKLSEVKDALVSQCHSRGFHGCDSLSYKGTYWAKGNVANYNFESEIVYHDSSSTKTGHTTNTMFHEDFPNDSDAEDQFVFNHEASNTASYSWSASQSTGIKASTTVTTEVSLPLVAKVGVENSFSVVHDWSSGSSHTATNTQTYSLSNTFKVPKRKCITACLTETQGEASVPYTETAKISGDLKKWVSWAGDADAFVCCYTREGGSDDCGALDHKGDGWALSSWPGWAVDHAKCPNFGYSGYSATVTSKGTFKADMSWSAKVVALQGTVHNCPGADECNNYFDNGTVV